MSDPTDSVVIVADRRIEPATLRRLVERHFGDIVKFVVDVDRGVAAVGGELHADPGLRARVQELTFRLIGEGEPLS